MDTKVLYVTAIILAAISGGYYYFSGSGNKLQVDAARSMKSTAENINLMKKVSRLFVLKSIDSSRICRKKPRSWKI